MDGGWIHLPAVSRHLRFRGTKSSRGGLLCHQQDPIPTEGCPCLLAHALMSLFPFNLLLWELTARGRREAVNEPLMPVILTPPALFITPHTPLYSF